MMSIDRTSTQPGQGRSTAAPELLEADMGQVDELVFRKTCKLLEPFNLRNQDLTPETNITTDLEIDSLAVLDLIMEVEEEYGISFPMNLIAEMRTIGDLVSAINEQTGKK